MATGPGAGDAVAFAADAYVEDTTSGLRRRLGPISLLFSCVGSIIGSGWLFGALYSAQIAGPAAIFSWVVGGVMILAIGLTFAELGTMFPVSGGVARFPQFSFGSFTSYTMGWVTWLAAAAVAPIEVEAALQYATNYAPFLTHVPKGTTVAVLTPTGYGVASAAMFVFTLVNIMGIRSFARLNNTVVWWKLAMIILVIVAFLGTTMHGGNFSAGGGFTPGGFHGIFEAIATGGIAFSYLGFRQGVELAGETKNPGRNVPLAIIGSVVITMIIYVALQIAFILALPPAALKNGWAGVGTAGVLGDLSFGPLAAIAKGIGFTAIAYLLYADAAISPGDTGLIYTTVTSRLSYAMGRNKNAPGMLAATSGRGVPWFSVIVTFVVGEIFFLPFPGWQKLVGFIVSATALSFGTGPLVWAAMRGQQPNRHRPFRLPGSHVIPFLAFYAVNLIIFWSGWDVDWKLFAGVGFGLLLLALYAGWKRFNHSLHELPPMEWRAGSWIIPYFGLLVLVSWLGSYPALKKHAGNQGILDLGTGAAVLFGLSVLIYAMAYHVKLPASRVEENIRIAAMSPYPTEEPSTAGDIGIVEEPDRDGGGRHRRT